jgi:peptidoglycan/xylan/chitin deacetylase (PgdA/CDA1 family)
MRQFLQCLWVAMLRASGGLWWARRQLRRRGAVVVLLLHRVLDEAEWRQTHSQGSMVLRSRTFRDLAEHLARRCQTVPVSKAAPGTAGQKVKIAITFDDAWCDTYAIALPVALACGLPATVFVCTGLTGCIAPFWPERVAAALRAMRPSAPEAATEVLIEHLTNYTPGERARWMGDLAHMLGAEEARGEPFEGDSTMTWEEICEMDRAGVAFGSHTHTHQVLPAVGAGVARREVRDSQAAIERKLGKCCDLFAYPHGAWSAEARQMLEEEGFRLAFTTERSAWTAECDPLWIPRANICEGDVAGLGGRFSPAMFEYSAFWKVWRAMRAEARPQVPANRRPEERAAA